MLATTRIMTLTEHTNPIVSIAIEHNLTKK